MPTLAGFRAGSVLADCRLEVQVGVGSMAVAFRPRDKRLGRPAELVAREAYPAFFAPVVPFEREAARIHGWELGAIPGLLQTEDYARAMISSGRPNDTAEAVGKLVTARMDRQVLLGGEHPPMLRYV